VGVSAGASMGEGSAHANARQVRVRGMDGRGWQQAQAAVGEMVALGGGGVGA